MKLQLLTMIPFILSMTLMTCTTSPMPEGQGVQNINQLMTSPWMVPEDAGLIHEEIDVEPEVIEITYEEMTEDIIAVWTLFLEDENIKETDSRWNNLAQYAEELADAIMMYQDAPTDIGGQLPMHRTTHVLMAVMVTKESSIKHKVVGTSRGEVGLMQIHGKGPLAGYDSKTVQANSRLGLLLGVRWFASRLPKCPMHRITGDSEGWRPGDWIKPLSVYAGGHRAINPKTKKCYSFKIAHERVDLTKLYITRINAAREA